MRDILKVIAENSTFAPRNNDVEILTDDVFTRGRLTVYNRHEDEAFGVMGFKENAKDWDLLLLDDYDKNFVKKLGLKTKPNEYILRYETDTTRIGNMRPMIKVNIDRGLVYFNVYDGDEDKVVFSKKGDKVRYMKIRQSYINN